LSEGDQKVSAEIPTAIIVALIGSGAVIGSALFALISALTNAWVARQNSHVQGRIAQRLKRAEFRQNWINALREAFVAFSSSIVDKSMENRQSVLTEQTSRIVLLMNRDDPDFETLMNAMSEFMSESKDENSRYRLVPLFQNILKREWNVVKDELALLEK
jgi:hypothetical protein